MIKRLFDFLISLFMIVLLLPVLVVIALAVRVNLGKPVLFRQTRPGLRGEPFVLVKFRTMTDERDSEGELLSDAERLTNFGRVLRASSLDELPQFFNVLCGDMSLVGPRPLLLEYLPLYTSEQARRHDVRPGITGWAQINGRNAIEWEDKFTLDVWYVNHHHFMLDLRILFMTALRIVWPRGVNQSDVATMTKFKGRSSENPSDE